MQSRIEKSIARYLAITLAPECGEVFKTLRAKRDGWIKMPDELELLRKNSGLGNTYVMLYEAESRIYFCLYKAIFPEDTAKQLEQFDAGLAAVSEAEKLTMLKDLNSEKSDEEISAEIEENFSQIDMTSETAQAEFEALPEEVRTAIIQRMQLGLAFFYATFFNSIALMVHGQKLTTLVPLALQGDKKAFCKAARGCPRFCVNGG